MILTKTSRDGKLIEIDFANANNALLRVTIDGAEYALGGDPKPLQQPRLGATHWVGSNKRAVGLTAEEAEIVAAARVERAKEISARERTAAQAKMQAERAAGIAAAERVQASLPEGKVAAYWIGTVTGGDDGWGEGTRTWYNFYQTLDGRRTGYDRATMSVAETHGWDDRPYVIVLDAQAATVDVEAKAQAERLAEEQAKAARKQTATSRRVARTAELRSVEVPAAAIAAYRRCGGDPERLPDDIDNPGYWMVRKFADAIEEQGLSYPAGSVIREAMRSDDATPCDD